MYNFCDCNKSNITLVIVVLILFSNITFALSFDNNYKKIITNIQLKDSVALSTDIYLPNFVNKSPVVFVRTPYGKMNFKWLAEYLVTKSYAVVIQDVRGKGLSGGLFEPFINELNDGLESLHWINDQEWCNGKIGMWGASYLSFCASILATENVPSLISIFNISGGLNLEKVILPGGATHLMLTLPWLLFDQSQKKKEFKKINPFELMSAIPLQKSFIQIEVDQIAERIFQFVKNLNCSNISPAEGILFFNLTGWFDFFNHTTFDLYEKIKYHSPHNKLLVGPWLHDQVFSKRSSAGDIDFGENSIMGVDNLKELTLSWFDFSLKGIKNGFENDNNVKLFIMGDNNWKEFSMFPPEKSNNIKLFMGSMNTLDGNHHSGILSHFNNFSNSHHSFIYNPHNPVPTLGGANFHFFPELSGIRDQSIIEKREDVLIYTSDPFDTDIEIIGMIKAYINISTEGNDTDFTAKLVELSNGGNANIITEGILRLSSYLEKNNLSGPKPNIIYPIEIDMGYTAIRISKGNRIRLEISSSNFPKYDRNPNTGQNSLTALNFVNVKQKVFYGIDYPSFVLLPINNLEVLIQ